MVTTGQTPQFNCVSLQTDRGRVQDFCFCREFSGRYLCTFHLSFAMDSKCCFLSQINFRELMDRWKQDNNVSFYYRTMTYFSPERNHSTRGGGERTCTYCFHMLHRVASWTASRRSPVAVKKHHKISSCTFVLEVVSSVVLETES